MCSLVCGVLMIAQAGADGATGPAKMLANMTDQVLIEIRNDPAILDDEDRTRRLADQLILPNIDFRVASQWVLGKHWRTASPSQREAFVDEFRALLVNTYLRSLRKYQDYTVRILAARPGQPDGRAVVDAEVLQPDGPPIKVMFRLHRQKRDWQVYDIVIEGVSLVATHRSGFATEIRDKGLDSLIAHLVVRNAGEATATGAAEQ
ncbi:MAG: ABC transporter substrate-binding protein [Halobacteria archaeon]|nr:ABC transporter substrate-binding protein [Halobacteria archaeon]